MPSLFQRRHYEWLAAFARRERAHMGPYSADAMIARLARELRDASGYDINGNKSFDEARFLRACEAKPPREARAENYQLDDRDNEIATAEAIRRGQARA